MIIKLSKENISEVLTCLGDGNLKNVKETDRDIVQKYFSRKWIGYGWYEISERKISSSTGKTRPHASWKALVGYCFIKHPRRRPETMTVVHKNFRNKGIATKLRNYAINAREFKGHIIYSSVELTNPASFKSILKSGFTVFDVTKDGYIQLMKVLPYGT